MPIIGTANGCSCRRKSWHRYRLYKGNVGWIVNGRTRKISKVTISSGEGMAGRMSWTPYADPSAGALLLLSTATSGAEVDWTETSAAAEPAVVTEAAAGAVVDDGTPKGWKAAALLLSATSPGYGTNDCEYLNTWLWSGWSRDEMESGVWPDCRTVLVSGVSVGDPSTKYP